MHLSILSAHYYQGTGNTVTVHSNTLLYRCSKQTEVDIYGLTFKHILSVLMLCNRERWKMQSTTYAFILVVLKKLQMHTNI